MRKLIYKIEGYNVVFNTETEDVERHLTLAEVIIENPTDEDIDKAQEIAYNGEYEIYDDGLEVTIERTTEERIGELEEALDLLLSGRTE